MGILATEIQTDPMKLGYASHLPDCAGQIVDLLNAPTFTRVGMVDRNQFSIWTVKYGVRAQIEDTAVNASSPLRSAALAMKDVLVTAGSSIDLGNPDLMAVVSAWGLSDAAKNDLIARATVPASRAQVLGLPPVTADDLHLEGVI